jgi:tetraacyldisaccharide 4'-kinase
VLLGPAALVTRAMTAHRVAQPGWVAPVPVICAGNPGVGGAGKTPVVLDLAARLLARGVAVHVLTRGYGGSAGGATRVDPARHGAAEVGDEALLLAGIAPTWTGADRAATARLAVAEGAQALLMDDGLQNPTLHKTASFLVVDGGAGFGNGRLLPAGPLREPIASAASRCRAAIMIGADRLAAAAALPPGMQVLQASLVPGDDMRALAGRRVWAFAGIGRPRKFFSSLEEAGATLAGSTAFADHYTYTAPDLARLRAKAAAHDAMLVTTAKDFVRIAPAARDAITPLSARLAWANDDAIEALLRELIP